MPVAAAYLFLVRSMAQLSDAGLSDAKDFVLRRLPFNLSRPRFIDHQREQIAEITSADSLFPAHLRHTSLALLAHDDPLVVRRALTCLAIVGTPADVAFVEPLFDHVDTDVKKYARTAIFEIERGI
jgi:hypothetical protein